VPTLHPKGVRGSQPQIRYDHHWLSIGGTAAPVSARPRRLSVPARPVTGRRHQQGAHPGHHRCQNPSHVAGGWSQASPATHRELRTSTCSRLVASRSPNSRHGTAHDGGSSRVVEQPSASEPAVANPHTVRLSDELVVGTRLTAARITFVQEGPGAVTAGGGRRRGCSAAYRIGTRRRTSLGDTVRSLQPRPAPTGPGLPLRPSPPIPPPSRAPDVSGARERAGKLAGFGSIDGNSADRALADAIWRGVAADPYGNPVATSAPEGP
jgi:hypothetical protein